METEGQGHLVEGEGVKVTTEDNHPLETQEGNCLEQMDQSDSNTQGRNQSDPNTAGDVTQLQDTPAGEQDIVTGYSDSPASMEEGTEETEDKPQVDPEQDMGSAGVAKGYSDDQAGLEESTEQTGDKPEVDPEQDMESAEQGVVSAEERELGVYEDEDDSDLDEAVADLDVELEPEILGEEIVESILRKDSKSATSTRKCRLESALSSIDEAEELTARAGVDEGETIVPDMEKRPATSGCETEMPLSRAKLNTPASNSVYTDITAEIRNLDSSMDKRVVYEGPLSEWRLPTVKSEFALRDTTRTQETREAVFRRALTLMSNRCTSVGQNTAPEVTMPAALMHSQEEPFGTLQPQYFYIKQRRPSPMAPLKAWRGYNGNVYFEPINIKSVGKVKVRDPSDDVHAAQLVKYDPRLGITGLKARPTSTPSSRPNTRQLLHSSSSRRAQRQTAVLDRRSVMSQWNAQLTQDMSTIEGREDTGSLAMRPPSSSSREARLAASNREKIVKGSVAQRLREQKQARLKPQLAVSGDKFSPMYTMSPLLRSQTQYSHSNQRMTMNSPDPHHAVYDHLPPLDQIRASLRHMDHMDSMSEPSYNRLSPYGRKVTLTDELKPFIKYSPDIRAKYLRQIQYLT